jgi:ubiquitin C
MQIHVKTPQGKTVTLNVHPNDTIQDIKKQVENKENIPVNDQRLEFNGKELKKPTSTLNDNNIRHGDTLNLQPMKINVRTSDGKKIIPIDNVEPTDTIGDIKKRVFKKEGIPIDDQRLAFHNKPLDDDKRTLKDCGIVHNDTLDLEGMHIFVKENWTDKKFKLFVEPTDTIDSIKDQIQKQEGHDKKNQYLIFKGVLLDDKPTLKDYGIKHKNVLNLERMKIFIKDYKGKTFTLDVRPDDSIDEIKQQIQDREGHPKDEQRLFFNNDLLDNPMKTLQDHGIKHKDTLELKKKPKEIVSPKPQKATLTPVSSPKGPEYTVGLSPWSDPFSPVGYSPKKKINRDGARAKSKDLLKDRYHTDFATEMEELGAMAKERIHLKRADEADMRKQVTAKPAK